MFEAKRFLASFRIILYTVLLLLSYEAIHLKLQPYLTSGIIVNSELLRLSSAKAYALESSGQKFCAIVGNSSGVDGFSISDLKKQTGKPWANFSIRGGSYRTLETLSEPLVVSGARLDVCVVPMHPLILAAQRRQTFRDEAKTKIAFQLQSLAFKLQGRGYHADLKVDPEEEHAGVEGRGTRHNRTHQLNGWEEKGMLQAESFTSDSAEYQAARRLLGKLSDISDRVIIVKMPEEVFVQEHVPPQAQVMFEQVSRGYEVLDLQGFLEPDEFADGVHPNELGRARINRALVNFIDGKL